MIVHENADAIVADRAERIRTRRYVQRGSRDDAVLFRRPARNAWTVPHVVETRRGLREGRLAAFPAQQRLKRRGRVERMRAVSPCVDLHGPQRLWVEP